MSSNSKAVVLVYDRSGKTVGEARASVQRFQTAAEGLTLNERDDLLFDLITAGMTDFNTEMTKQMRTHIAKWVRF